LRLDPIDSLLRRVPTVQLDHEQMKRLQMGQKLSPRSFLEQLSDQAKQQVRILSKTPSIEGDTVVAKAYGPEQQLLGTVEIDHQALKPRRLVRTF
jgi:tRNA U55 pseudouridine synthase TruB